MVNFFSISKHSLYSALVVGCAVFLVMLDSTIIVTSMPKMAESFGVSVVDLSLGVSIYLLTTVVFIPPAGWLADRWGPLRVFLIAIVIFCVASLVCGVAEGFVEFVVARAFQGLGGALMVPVGRMMVLHFSEKSELTRAMTILTWPALTAPVLGPVVGGFITTYIDWRWNFYINIPIGILVFIFALKSIPSIPPVSRRPFDLRGFILCALGLAGFLGGIDSFSHDWLTVFGSFSVLGLGLFFIAWAVVHLHRASVPLLNLEPVKIRTFAVATVTTGTWFRIGLNAPAFLLPLYLQLGFSYSPFVAGAYVMVYFIGNLATKAVSPLVIARLGFRKLLWLNGLCCGLSMCLFTLVDPNHAVAPIVVLLLLSGVFRSLQFGALNALTFADISKRLRSSAAPLSVLSMQMSAALTVALTVLVLQASKRLGGRDTLDITDFNIAFLVMGGASIVLSFLFLRLSPEDGGEVSGHIVRRQ